MYKYLIFAFLVPFIFFYQAEAYELTDTTAYRLNDQYVLYTVSFQMGFLNRVLSLPLATTNTKNPLGAEINFATKDNAGDAVKFKTHSVLLSTGKAKLKNGKYTLPMGKNDVFTFVAIAEIPKGDTEYSLAITKLPYITIDADNTTRLSLIDEKTITTFKTEAVK